MATQGIEGLVVVFLFQVRQFVNHNHAQKGFRPILKYCRHTNFRFGFELVALNTGHRRVQAQRVIQHVDLAVISDFINRRRIAQILIFEILRPGIQRFIRRDVMRIRIAFLQHFPKTLFRN
ncbi:hypothetical protein D3C75_1181880 [compost metagenome]